MGVGFLVPSILLPDYGSIFDFTSKYDPLIDDDVGNRWSISMVLKNGTVSAAFLATMFVEIDVGQCGSFYIIRFDVYEQVVR